MSNIHSLLQLMATLALHGVTTVRKAGPRNILRRHRTTPVLLSIRVVVIKKHALPISQATATGLPDYPKGKLSSRDRRSSCCPYLISKLLLFFFFFCSPSALPRIGPVEFAGERDGRLGFPSRNFLVETSLRPTLSPGLACRVLLIYLDLSLLTASFQSQCTYSLIIY